MIVDEGEFTARNLAKAGYEQSPLEDGSLSKWQVVHFNISQLTLDAVKPFGLGNKEALRCKNMWTLGLALWMFDRDRAPIVDWLKTKFAKAPELAEANIAALNAGHAYGETVEMGAPFKQHHIAAAPAEPGLYRTVTGAEALALGLVAGCQLAGVNMFFGSYPITPASPLLHHLARSRSSGSRPSRRRTRSPRSAPRSARVTPASSASPRRRDRESRSRWRRSGLAFMTELPLVVVNSQRGGPRRASDQDRAVRPLPGGVRPQRRHAAAGHRRAFARGRVRMRDRGVPHRDPLHDAGDAADRRLYRQCRRAVARAGHGRVRAVPGRLFDTPPAEGEGVMPYARNADLARPWIKPGTPGLEHRIGGIEKQPGTGNIDYRPEVHQEMTEPGPARSSASRTRFRTRKSALAAKAPSWRWSAGARPSARSTRRCAARSLTERTLPTSTFGTSGRCRRICLSY